MAKQSKKGRFAPKLKLKKGDQVVVITGVSKGKKGEILEIFPKTDKLIVEGINVRKKHQKPTQDNPGGIIDKAMPVHISNVMLLDPKSGEPTRIGRRVEGDKIVRYSKKSGEIIN